MAESLEKRRNQCESAIRPKHPITVAPRRPCEEFAKEQNRTHHFESKRPGQYLPRNTQLYEEPDAKTSMTEMEQRNQMETPPSYIATIPLLSDTEDESQLSLSPDSLFMRFTILPLFNLLFKTYN